MNVYFHDPHPGLVGPRAPIPYAVKELADNMDGKTGVLEDFVAAVRLACPGGSVTVHADFVSLQKRDDAGIVHNWRVIRFDRPETKQDERPDA
jgi:hypothetical protein